MWLSCGKSLIFQEGPGKSLTADSVGETSLLCSLCAGRKTKDEKSKRSNLNNDSLLLA